MGLDKVFKTYFEVDVAGSIFLVGWADKCCIALEFCFMFEFFKGSYFLFLFSFSRFLFGSFSSPLSPGFRL